MSLGVSESQETRCSASNPVLTGKYRANLKSCDPINVCFRRRFPSMSSLPWCGGRAAGYVEKPECQPHRALGLRLQEAGDAAIQGWDQPFHTASACRGMLPRTMAVTKAAVMLKSCWHPGRRQDAPWPGWRLDDGRISLVRMVYKCHQKPLWHDSTTHHFKSAIWL